MTILIDIDGVIFNTQETLLNIMNTIYQTNYSFEEINYYEWFDEHFLNPWRFLEQETFWNFILVNQDAVEFISKWIEQGHTVKFVTATHYHQAINAKMRKLKNSFSGLIEDKDIIVCHDKSMVRGDILIDDYFDNCTNFGNYAILFSQPWNSIKQIEDITNILRLDDWEKIDRVIQYIKE